MDVFILKNGGRLGPFKVEEVANEVHAGRVNLQDHVWVNGWGHWKQLKDAHELLPRIVVPPVLPPRISPKIHPEAPDARTQDSVRPKPEPDLPIPHRGRVPWVFGLIPFKYMPDDYGEGRRYQILWRHLFLFLGFIGLIVFPVPAALLTVHSYKYAYGTASFWILGWPSCCLFFVATPGFIRLIVHAPVKTKLRSMVFFAVGLPAGGIIGLVVSLIANYEKMDPDPLMCALFAGLAGAIAGYAGGTQPNAKKLSWA